MKNARVGISCHTFMTLAFASFLFLGGCGDNDDNSPSADAGTDTSGSDAGQPDGSAVPDATEDATDDLCSTYPCAPFGTALGDVIQDLSWEAANASAIELAGDDGMLDFHDLYQANEAHGGTLRGLFVWHTTGWCPYCADEAPRLQALYEQYADQGILFIGAVDEDESGAPATASYAESYGDGYGWTFPVVAGGFDEQYWPPADVDSGEIGVPLHMFIDLRTMQIYGRYSGAAPDFIPLGVEPLTEVVEWGDDGERILDFDCAPGTGTETEPNDENTPESGTSLPYTLSAVICPGTIADGIMLDRDIIDLGTLSAGDVIDVQMTPTGTSEVYPFMKLIRRSDEQYRLVTLGPVILDAAQAGRQWVIDQAGSYMLMASDGREWASAIHGDSPIPADDACCVGGAEYTYDLTVEAFALVPTETALTTGDTAGGFSDGNLMVYPFTVTNETTYQIRLIADDDQLDPYLSLYDPDTSSVLAFNDDEDYAGGNINSYVSYTATSDTTIYVVASYWGIWFKDTPSFTLSVE